GAHQPGRAAVGGFEDRVDLGLHGGGVFLEVHPERQQPAGGAGRGGGAGRAGDRQQQGPGRQVRPPAHRHPLQGGPRAGRGEFGGETVEQGGLTAQRGVPQHRGDDRCGTGGQLVVEAPPARPRQVAQPGAGRGQQVGRVVLPARGGGGRLLGGGAAEGLGDPGRQRVVDGAEQGGAGGGEGDEVVLARGPGGRLVGGLRDACGERRSGDGVGQFRQGGALGGLWAQEPGDEHVVECVHGGERLVESVDAGGQHIGVHQATVL